VTVAIAAVSGARSTPNAQNQASPFADIECAKALTVIASIGFAPITGGASVTACWSDILN